MLERTRTAQSSIEKIIEQRKAAIDILDTGILERMTEVAHECGYPKESKVSEVDAARVQVRLEAEGDDFYIIEALSLDDYANPSNEEGKNRSVFDADLVLLSVMFEGDWQQGVPLSSFLQEYDLNESANFETMEGAEMISISPDEAPRIMCELLTWVKNHHKEWDNDWSCDWVAEKMI